MTPVAAGESRTISIDGDARALAWNVSSAFPAVAGQLVGGTISITDTTRSVEITNVVRGTVLLSDLVCRDPRPSDTYPIQGNE